MTTGAT